MLGMRAAASIVAGIFAAAFTVSYWPAAQPALPIPPRGAAPAAPASLIVPPPAHVPLRLVRVESHAAGPPAPAVPASQPMAAVLPVAMPLDAHPLSIDAEAVPATLMAADTIVPEAGRGAVARGLSTAGRQISGAFRTAGSAIRSAF